MDMHATGTPIAIFDVRFTEITLPAGKRAAKHSGQERKNHLDGEVVHDVTKTQTRSRS